MKKWLIIASGIIVFSIVGYKIYDRYYYSGEVVIIKYEGDKVYHRVDCPLVKKASGSSIIIMDKEKLARQEYRPCKTCHPTYDTKYILQIRKIKEQEDKEKEIKEASESTKNIYWTSEDFKDTRNKQNGDIKKVIIAGNSSTNNYGLHKTTCVVKNNDSVAHTVNINAIYYNNKKIPISSVESNPAKINAGEIKGFTIEQFNNAENIKSYELKIINKDRSWLYN